MRFLFLLFFISVSSLRAETPTLLECVAAVRAFSQNQNPAPLNIAQTNIAALLQIVEGDSRIESLEKANILKFLGHLERDPHAYVEVVSGRSAVINRLEQWANAVDESELAVNNHLIDLSEAAISGNQPATGKPHFMQLIRKNIFWILLSMGMLGSVFSDDQSRMQIISSYLMLGAGGGLLGQSLRKYKIVDADAVAQQIIFERNGVKSLPRNLFSELLVDGSDEFPSSSFFWTTSFTDPVRNFLRKEFGISDAWIKNLKGRNQFIYISTAANGEPILFFASGSSNF